MFECVLVDACSDVVAVGRVQPEPGVSNPSFWYLEYKSPHPPTGLHVHKAYAWEPRVVLGRADSCIRDACTHVPSRIT
jgi:hypothetical protein